ncbi:Anaphase-promoting complex subunit [Sesamum angolense]|uniref:Anaphase-promoting complex subunit n=1 Tax=Sesamum angolense TaxID=2727404 RepID=A0AAE2BYG0_9LAMI|nr:Anaphase-promoting complex subunit [Sesamum angolense]
MKEKDVKSLYISIYRSSIFSGNGYWWHAVASWTWDAQDETCGICRMAFDGCCPDCKLPGDDCPLRSGSSKDNWFLLITFTALASQFPVQEK